MIWGVSARLDDEPGLLAEERVFPHPVVIDISSELQKHQRVSSWAGMFFLKEEGWRRGSGSPAEIHTCRGAAVSLKQEFSYPEHLF